MMNEILQEFVNKVVVVYIYDIVTYSKTVEEHTIHLRNILQRLCPRLNPISFEQGLFHFKKWDFMG